MTNPRFLATEISILQVILQDKKALSFRVIARRAKISRSTLYRHHKGASDILPDLEKYLLHSFDRLMGGLMRQPRTPIATLYLQTLVFILQNRRYFTLLVRLQGASVLETIMRRLARRVAAIYALPDNSSKLLHVFVKEATAILEIWVRGGCRTSEDEVLHDLLYLTRTLRTRLGGLLN